LFRRPRFARKSGSRGRGAELEGLRVLFPGGLERGLECLGGGGLIGHYQQRPPDPVHLPLPPANPGAANHVQGIDDQPAGRPQITGHERRLGKGGEAPRRALSAGLAR
jgi:hypothetical protein